MNNKTRSDQMKTSKKSNLKVGDATFFYSQLNSFHFMRRQ